MANRLVHWLCTLAVVAVLAPAAGCIITGDDDPPCYEPDYAYGLRDPQTGVCNYYGGGGGCYGEDDLVYADSLPNMASCPGQCEGLDENSCLATPGCRGAYEGWVCPPNADCAPEDSVQFFECWGTAPSGPVQGECWNLDAWSCSAHDDCIAIYQVGIEYGGHQFSQCAPEPEQQACGPDGSCPIGSHCEYRNPTDCGDQEPCPPYVEAVCVPDDLTCYSDQDCPGGYECTSDTECLPAPGCDEGMGCPPVCYGKCVPRDNACAAVDCQPGYTCIEQCTEPYPDGEARCEAVCVPVQTTCDSTDCGPGYHCEEQCYPCDPGPNGGMCESDPWCSPVCVPNPDPGECYGDVLCDALPPSCPEGTLPGVSNGCWSGFCIPVAECTPRDPGTCNGEVACDAAPPACPEGTLPGIDGACWSGYCIPVWACDDPPAPTCEELGDEAACVERADCAPIYEGGDCTCRPDGSCTCNEWRFSRCETSAPPPPMMPD